MRKGDGQIYNLLIINQSWYAFLISHSIDENTGDEESDYHEMSIIVIDDRITVIKMFGKHNVTFMCTMIDSKPISSNYLFVGTDIGRSWSSDVGLTKVRSRYIFRLQCRESRILVNVLTSNHILRRGDYIYSSRGRISSRNDAGRNSADEKLRQPTAFKDFSYGPLDATNATSTFFYLSINKIFPFDWSIKSFEVFNAKWIAPFMCFCSFCNLL